jgi:hypothetical protein
MLGRSMKAASSNLRHSGTSAMRARMPPKRSPAETPQHHLRLWRVAGPCRSSQVQQRRAVSARNMLLPPPLASSLAT